MSDPRSTRILGVAGALADLARQATAASPPGPGPAFEAGLHLVTRIEERRQGRFPSAAAQFAPLPMSHDLRWPPSNGLRLRPSGFWPAVKLRLIRGTPPLPQTVPDTPPAWEFRPPRDTTKDAPLDAVEFGGPPVRLPAFSCQPLRHRYYADPVLLSAPRLVSVEISSPPPLVEPMELVAAPVRIGSMLASVAAILKSKGK